MKKINIIFILIFYYISKYSNQQKIIIPIDIDEIDNSKEDGEEEGQPIIETKELKANDGKPVQITRIHFHSSKNLNGNSEASTPFQIIRIFDSRVNNIFDEIIRHAIVNTFFNEDNVDDKDENEEDDIGTIRDKKIIKRMKRKINKDNKNEEDDIFNEIEKEFELEEVSRNDKKSKNDNNNNTNSNLTNKANENSENKNNKESKETKIKNKKNVKNKKNIFKINYDKMKKRTKKKKKLSRKELIFSRVCKYIFYSIILFTIYTLIKKFLEYLGVIETEDANSIEDTIPDEETTKLKRQENKLN